MKWVTIYQVASTVHQSANTRYPLENPVYPLENSLYLPENNFGLPVNTFLLLVFTCSHLRQLPWGSGREPGLDLYLFKAFERSPSEMATGIANRPVYMLKERSIFIENPR
jgi:hypothetical protein